MLKLKIENWKHCSKIIFKCVNSAMRPIFNEKIVEKWSLWVREQCTDALLMEDLVNNCGWGKKREEKTRTWKKKGYLVGWIHWYWAGCVYKYVCGFYIDIWQVWRNIYVCGFLKLASLSTLIFGKFFLKIK